jgi:hypothetical protein
LNPHVTKQTVCNRRKQWASWSERINHDHLRDGVIDGNKNAYAEIRKMYQPYKSTKL